MDQPDFGLPGRTYYLEDRLSHMREAYVTFASSVAKLFGADASLAESEMRAVLAFETDIANVRNKKKSCYTICRGPSN